MGYDPTEIFRRYKVKVINSEVKSDDEQEERKRLEAQYGQIWNTEELQRDFEVVSFLAPYVSVIRKHDGIKGVLMFQDYPRFYFNFESIASKIGELKCGQ